MKVSSCCHTQPPASSLLLQVVLSLACLALASAAPQQPYVDPEAGAPKPYSYAYAVADDYSKANFQKTESQDSNVRRNMPSSCSAELRRDK